MAIIILAKSYFEILTLNTFILIEQNNSTTIQFDFSKIIRVKDI